MYGRLTLAYQSVWYFTDLPKKVIETIEEDLEKYKLEKNLEESRIGGGGRDSDVRNARNTWIPTTHWTAGFLWHYIMRANRENFLYDLTNIDGESMQYTVYGEGEYYTWHSDADMDSAYKPQAINNIAQGYNQQALLDDFVMKNVETMRKLSFSIQLSDPDEYEGGQFQLLDERNKSYIAPREKGTIILFDSRTKHRVRPVTKGVRKSIVGWVVGPRWR